MRCNAQYIQRYIPPLRPCTTLTPSRATYAGTSVSTMAWAVVSCPHWHLKLSIPDNCMMLPQFGQSTSSSTVALATRGYLILRRPNGRGRCVIRLSLRIPVSVQNCPFSQPTAPPAGRCDIQHRNLLFPSPSAAVHPGSLGGPFRQFAAVQRYVGDWGLSGSRSATLNVKQLTH